MHDEEARLTTGLFLMGGRIKGMKKRMSWITAHSLFSLRWDEWASLVAIGTAIILTLRWFINRLDSQLFDSIRRQLTDINRNLEEYNKRQRASEKRLERGDKKFIVHDEELKDHERRITSLEVNEHDKN